MEAVFSTKMINHFNITVYGEVQGVFFRRTIKHEANRRGIAGFVRNELDGTVYIEAEAEEKVLDEFVVWLKSGAGAGGDYKISQVEVQPGHFKAFTGFEIKG